MTNKELVLSMLIELSTKEISEAQNPDSFDERVSVARQCGAIALNVRLELERKTGKAIITSLNAQNVLRLQEGKKLQEKKYRITSTSFDLKREMYIVVSVVE